MTQAEMLLGVELKKGWQLDVYGNTFRWECSLEPRESSYGSGHEWRLRGKRFGAPMALQPDEGWLDNEVLSDMLATFLALEEHESFEWFKVGGRPFIDPHHHAEFNYRSRKSEWYERLINVRGGDVYKVVW